MRRPTRRARPPPDHPRRDKGRGTFRAVCRTRRAAPSRRNTRNGRAARGTRPGRESPAPLLSSRLDVLPQEITDELAGLQDEVPAENFDAILAAAQADIGEPLADRYEWIDAKPLAAASLGQVHRARLCASDAEAAGFSDVVVKVQRPFIDQIVDIFGALGFEVAIGPAHLQHRPTVPAPRERAESSGRSETAESRGDSRVIGNGRFESTGQGLQEALEERKPAIMAGPTHGIRACIDPRRW